MTINLRQKTEAVFADAISIPPTPSDMDENEWLTRLELAACYRLVDHYGWTSVVYNHITLRVPGTNEFLINPFGLRYDEIQASNLIRVDVDGNKKSESKWPVNKAGYLIHSTLHQAREDLHCVIYTESSSTRLLTG